MYSCLYFSFVFVFLLNFLLNFHFLSFIFLNIPMVLFRAIHSPIFKNNWDFQTKQTKNESYIIFTKMTLSSFITNFNHLNWLCLANCDQSWLCLCLKKQTWINNKIIIFKKIFSFSIVKQFFNLKTTHIHIHFLTWCFVGFASFDAWTILDLTVRSDSTIAFMFNWSCDLSCDVELFGCSVFGSAITIFQCFKCW